MDEHRAATALRIAYVAVAGVVLACLVGLALLWPDRSLLPEPTVDATRDELVAGEIVQVETLGETDDPFVGGGVEELSVDVRLLDGPDQGTTTTLSLTSAGLPPLDAGDRVNLARSVVAQPDGSDEVGYFLVDFPRGRPLAVLALVLVVLVVALGGWLGVRALLSLSLSLLVVTQFVLPAILTGSSPFAVALVGAVSIMVLALYLTHGVSPMTTSAVLGTSVALLVTIAIGAVAITSTKLTGLTDEYAQQATFAVESLDVRGLVLAGLIIATLGVLDDVTIAQASTVQQLHRTDPSLSAAGLAGRALTVGRDHVASTINTLFLAYAGASLAILLVFSTSGLPAGELLTSEVVAEELVKTIVGSLGLMTAVPLTTLLAAVLVTAGVDLGDGHDHGHGHGGDHDDRRDRTRRGRGGARDAGDAAATGDAWTTYLRTGRRAHDDEHDRP